MQDPYRVLGVDRNASLSEIKKAFKLQAMKNHPDKGGDERKFKEINNAYSAITKGETNNRDTDFPFDVFQREVHSMFTNGFQFHTNMGPMFTQPSVTMYEFRLSLDGFFTGKTLNVNAKNVNIPKNTPVNSVIDVPNCNLKIKLKAKKHSMFSLDMYHNLVLSEQISLFEALIGFKKKIKLPSGKSILIQRDKCIEPNQTFIVRNCGMPAPNGKFTHLLVNLKVIFPKKIDFTKHVEQLKEIFGCNIPSIFAQQDDIVIHLNESI